MRRLLVAFCFAIAVVGLCVGDVPSGAFEAATMVATPTSSPEPGTVTVTNTDDDPSTNTDDDPSSTCRASGGGAAPAVVTPVEVSLTLTGDNDQLAPDTVTPSADGDWAQTYTGLPAGTSTVTGDCQDEAPTGARPTNCSPFDYVPVTFVVTASTADGGTPTTSTVPDVSVAPTHPVAANPAFTG